MKSNFIMAASSCKITRLQSMDIFLLTDKFKSSSNYFYGTNQYFQRPTYANWPEAVRIRIASVALEVELVSIKRTGGTQRPGPVYSVKASRVPGTAAAAVTGPVWGAEET